MYFYAQLQSDTRLEASLNKNLYNEADLITLKVPLFLPYQNDQANYERVDGEININGKIYKYVKRKIENGTLVLMCLPDYNKMNLQKQKDDFCKDANNIAQNTGSKKQENSKGNSYKNIVSDYEQLHTKYAVALFATQVCHYLSAQICPLHSALHNSPEQPPDAA